jgi:hypothetical protein
MFGIHMLLGNSHILTEDFTSLRLRTQGVTYPSLQSKWTLSVSRMKLGLFFSLGVHAAECLFPEIQYKIKISQKVRISYQYIHLKKYRDTAIPIHTVNF